MKEQEYLRLDYLKQRGGELAIGDEYLFCTCEFNIDETLLSEISTSNMNDSHRLITHLSFRDNKGKPNLPEDFPVRVIYDDGINDSDLVGNFRWSSTGEFDITKWKPNYELLLKQQKKYDSIEELNVSKREQDVPDEELIYTVAMKEKGELPKAGMKCVVDKVNCLYIGLDSRGHAVLEHLEDGDLVGTVITRIHPIKTLSELKAEREEELKDKVAEVLSNNSGTWLSKVYFKKHAQDLFDEGLLRDVSED